MQKKRLLCMVTHGAEYNAGREELCVPASDWYRDELLPYSLMQWLRVTTMRHAMIAIPLDPERARAHDSASPEEKRKIQA